ncbi:MAG: LD-carboxypeptidase [Clostridia bacterium]|nr:LD-carboxypeptidase [Clostridia bacterium]
MNKIIPNKLNKGDEIRVIAPSRSMCILSEEIINFAKIRLETLGFKVTFSKNVSKSLGEDYRCASIEDRIEDLHDAFKDKNVKAILTVIGGFNVNQILDYIDYNLIKENPKIICGFSDITALTNAIYAKTGMLTYSGPHFSSFGMKKGFEYTEQYFKKMFMQNEKVIIKSSEEWSNDSWFKNQEKRIFIPNEGMKIINKGQAEGKIIGGNLCTLNLLQGTEYMPDLEDSILFIEDDGLVDKVFNKEFDRDLQSLLHCAKNKKIKGIVVGRAENNCDMTNEKWVNIFKNKKELVNIPIVINANFGHTTPIFTFPIGGYAKIQLDEETKIEIED